MKNKTILCCAALAFTALVNAQPIVQNSFPATGYSTDAFSATVSSPGAAGANQTWDFSAVTFTNIGTGSVADPSTGPFISNFPGTNWDFVITTGGNMLHNYHKISANMLELLGSNITAAPSGNSYTTNPQTILKFPFNYGDTLSDTWVKNGGSPNQVVLKYDGYGTVKTPNGTYTNVVRVQYYYPGSTPVSDYTWYQVNPVRVLLIYNHSGSMTSLENGTTTGIHDHAEQSSPAVYPNPSADGLFRLAAPLKASSVATVYDLSGKTALSTVLPAGAATLDLSRLDKGMYIAEIRAGSDVIHARLVIR